MHQYGKGEDVRGIGAKQGCIGLNIALIVGDGELSDQYVVRKECAKLVLKAVKNWNIELLDEDLRPRSKFFDGEEAVAWKRCTHKNIDEEWCAIASEIDKAVFCKYVCMMNSVS